MEYDPSSAGEYLERIGSVVEHVHDPTIADVLAVALRACGRHEHTFLKQGLDTAVVTVGPFVLRVSSTSRSPLNGAAFLRTADTLYRRGVPTPRPLGGITTGEFDVTLWVGCDGGTQPGWDRLGETIRSFHDTPVDALEHLPTFRTTLDEIDARVESILLLNPDLTGAWTGLMRSLPAAPVVVLHGDVHPGNVIWADRPLLCDLERMVTGPAEWDFAKLALEGDGYPDERGFQQVLTGYGRELDKDVLASLIRVARIAGISWRVEQMEATGADTYEGATRESLLTDFRVALASL